MTRDSGRFFAAIPIPQDLKSALRRVQQRLKPGISGFRWVDPERMHITLLFLGDQPREAVDQLGDALIRDLGVKESFNVRLAGVGAFPTLHRPRVVWIGISDGAENITDLHNCLRTGAQEVDLIQKEATPFHPHLTLARAKKAESTRKPISVDAVGESLNDQFYVDRVEMIESELTPKGPVYRVQKTFCLNGGISCSGL